MSRGDRQTCVFVDNGLLRLHEGHQVMDAFAFAVYMGVKVIRVTSYNSHDIVIQVITGAIGRITMIQKSNMR